MTTTAFHGGTIRTGNRDGSCDWVLVEDDTIRGVGTGDAPGADRTVDLDGAVLVPAFRDGHAHLPATGLYAAGMDFRGQGSTAAIVAAFRERAKSGEILFGGNFETLDEPLTRVELDEAVGDRPALLARADLHSGIVSSALLEKLTLDGVEGVDRDDDGRPIGFLREQAASEAWKWFDSSLSPQQQREAVLTAVDIAYSRGIAEVHEMFVVEWRGWDSAEAFLATIGDVALNVPVYLGTDDVDRVYELGFRRIGGDWFLDGSFGSHTAWMRAPFTSQPPSGSSPNGIAYRTDEQVFEFFHRAQSRGMQVGVHAIGDAAIDQVVRNWTLVAEGFGVEAVRSLHHRIEHFECSDDTHIETAAHLGLTASVQPAFDAYWGGAEGLYAERIGWDRAATMNRFKTMIQSGVTIGGGSDSTVTPLDPFLQMDALRRHHVHDEGLDAHAALWVMTRGVSRLAPTEGNRGEIEAGAWAEFALLDRDPLMVGGDDLLKTEVLGTWVRGQRVWPKAEAETS
jgi:predicted amidohydrolase YtcJ